MSTLPIATRILKPLETNVSTGMFLRDTGGCLFAKLGASRTKDETREISFAELAESAIFYFSIPPVAYLASKGMGALFNVSKTDLTKNLETLTNKAEKNLDAVKMAKLGKIGLTFSLLLPAIYAIAPLRNIMTYAVTGKEKFTNVVNLKKEKTCCQKEQTQKKAKKLLTRVGLAGIAGIGLTTAMMGLHSLPATKKYVKPVTDFVLKHLDFEGNAGLSLKQLGFLVMPISVKSYFDASRDKYEKFENARRFSITIPMMFFGQDLIEKNIYKFFDKKFGSTLSEGKNIIKYDQILKMPENKRLLNLKSKNLAIASAFMINTLGLAFAVGWLNRLSSKSMYEKDCACAPCENNVKQWLNQLQQ